MDSLVLDSNTTESFFDKAMAERNQAPRPENGLQAIRYERGSLEVLDQLKLPHEKAYDKVETCEGAFDCIKAMRVRGAPAIAIVAALALAVELFHKNDGAIEKGGLLTFIKKKLDYLMGSRPTAVDLSNAIKRLKAACETEAENALTNDELLTCTAIREAYIKLAEKIFKDDYDINIKIGQYGAEYLRRQQEGGPMSPIKEEETKTNGTQAKMSVLTHCNTGSLATSGHGTALGIIRSLWATNSLRHAYCTETRPYNQGSRLTAFELQYEGIPSTLITDSMAGALFKRQKEWMNITAVIVGADRVARNGDTANKIGTYSLAVLAKHHNIKFIVAAPTTSIDLETETGNSIVIENRPQKELTQITGAIVDTEGNVDPTKTARVAIADQTINVWNPSFDVTPYALIDAIITEKGEVTKDSRGNFNFENVMPTQWRNLGLRISEDSAESVGVVSNDVATPGSLDGIHFKMSLEKVAVTEGL